MNKIPYAMNITNLFHQCTLRELYADLKVLQSIFEDFITITSNVQIFTVITSLTGIMETFWVPMADSITPAIWKENLENHKKGNNVHITFLF